MHVPETQLSPSPQVTHAEPRLPHAIAEPSVWHRPVGSQHPLAHVAAEHV